MKAKFIPCRQSGLGWECSPEGWIVRQRVGHSGKFEPHVEGRCECWKQWRRRQG